MISSKVFFARLNENRNGQWASDTELLKGVEEYFKVNGFDKMEYGKNLEHGFSSPIVGSKSDGNAADGQQRIVTIFKSQIDKYDMKFFASLESFLYNTIDSDSDASTALMLVTDSLSYDPITKIEELGVIFETLMDDGLIVLFVNNKTGYAMFDKYAKIFQPIPVEY